MSWNNAKMKYSAVIYTLCSRRLRIQVKANICSCNLPSSREIAKKNSTLTSDEGQKGESARKENGSGFNSVAIHFLF